MRPCSLFLTMKYHEIAYKRFYSEREMEPASLATKYNTRQNELCTAMAWLGMTRKKPDQPKVEPLHSHEACNQQLQPDTSQTHPRSSVPLARVAFDCLALPCLALPCLALPCLALPCLALPCLALPCLALPCLALPCLALPCLALPCLALPCLALPCLALPCLALPCLALPCLACAALLPLGKGSSQYITEKSSPSIS